MSVARSAQLAVLYEHRQWFQPLFAALSPRGTPDVAIELSGYRFDPASRDVPAPLVLGRLAQSSFLREPGHRSSAAPDEPSGGANGSLRTDAPPLAGTCLEG